ncbi:adenylyl-sulfate kinase [Rhizobium rhizosphaerae]|uniref:Adenylyl-sulfate kinase n=1 Tax=Xaviernesmea rhizosphaerae TaxID=1672749 RepID=A0ABX3PFL7_9HYPH|nr:adenylyl-sulfate kinase [Xaviernesmea rhizosphaerae]OQP87207.1 adenylyl-sulfate kinase [Xaviernesmea rhizosphaerae]
MTKLSFYSLTSAFRRAAGESTQASAPPAAPRAGTAGTLLICGTPGEGRAQLAKALADEAGLTWLSPQAQQSPQGDAQQSWTIEQSEDEAGETPLARLEALIMADLVLLAVDVRESNRDAMGNLLIRHHLFRRGGLVIVLTGLDAIEDGRASVETIRAELATFCGDRAMPPLVPLFNALSARSEVRERTAATPEWFAGPTLGAVIEAETVRFMQQEDQPFRLAVTAFDRSRPEAPAVEGTVCQGRIAAGEPIRILPGGMLSSVGALVSLEPAPRRVTGPAALRLTLSEPVACQPGQIIVPADRPCEVTDQFEAAIAWFDSEPLLPGRSYGLDLGGQSATASVTRLRAAADLDMADPVEAESLGCFALGMAHMALETPLAFDVDSNGLSCFYLTDPATGRIVGLGRIHQALRRADNIHWQALAIDRSRRAAMKHQAPLVVWMTGLSGAGKSAIANLAELKLAAAGKHTFLLDGDNMRHGLNRDLGFTEPDRVENIRRVAEVARLMSDAGLIVLCAFISPFRSDRQMARKLMAPGEFIEVHVKASVELAESRDPKGLYRKARAGELKNFTGIDSPYEEPETAELVLDTAILSAAAAADLLVDFLLDRLMRNAPTPVDPFRPR